MSDLLHLICPFILLQGILLGLVISQEQQGEFGVVALSWEEIAFRGRVG